MSAGRNGFCGWKDARFRARDSNFLRCWTRNNHACDNFGISGLACNIWLDFSACPNILDHEFRRVQRSGDELDMRRARILVVDDDATLRHVTQAHLAKTGYPTVTATEALEILKREPRDLVITDLYLPGMSGLELLKSVRTHYPETEVVLITAFANVATALDAMKSGAYDYITTPVHLGELGSLVERALGRVHFIEELRELRAGFSDKYGFENIVGQSQALLFVLDQVARVAPTEATVLIIGETGSGKEVLAKAVHRNSLRRERPFVTINCCAIPTELLQSELFGHLRGSFTGATTDKRGKIEIADTGTLFLDEISELPLELQARLLRLIQEREIEKIGALYPTKVDVRIIAAANRDLQALAASGSFREDLYYRLSVVPIELPPLRNRAEDIPLFVQHFFDASKQRHGRPDLTLPPLLIPYFTAYTWPGNVRQLENVIERLVILSGGEQVTLNDLPEFLLPATRVYSHSKPSGSAGGLNLQAVERDLIIRALNQFSWNQSRAANYLGITRKTLMYRMIKYGIQKQRPESAAS
jgi:DNA-binding NtrC family response regulator